MRPRICCLFQGLGVALIVGVYVSVPLLAQQTSPDIDVDLDVNVEAPAGEAQIAQSKTCEDSRMEVSSLGQNLWVRLKFDAEAALGFDHLPKTEVQTEQVNELISLLNDPSQMIELDAFAKCEVSGATVGGSLINKTPLESQVLSEHLDAPDIQVRYRFICSNMDQLKKLKASYFNHLQNLNCTQMELEAVERPVPNLTRVNPVLELK